MLKKILTGSIHCFQIMGRSFYAVRRGRRTGVYLTWDECKNQVHGFAGARYKKFGTEDEAWGFVSGTDDKGSGVSTSSQPKLLTETLSSGYSCPIKTFKRSHSTDAEPAVRAKRKTIQQPSASEHASGLVVYTDGACTHNGAHGARAGIGVYWGDEHPLNYSARLEGKQTNQRAELTAALKALEQIKAHHKGRPVTLYTDSKYTINCVTDWIHKWKTNGWKTSQKTDVINKDDLIKLDVLNKELTVDWKYVPGHSNVKGNEKADRLAREGADQPLPSKGR
ncbi:ribonuclease H1-like [Diadema antillarum]|uniref:ribonuclease H1-like n=1 Tax=Diadema antillarum TaxID=105358 RepID=UPI003A8479C1